MEAKQKRPKKISPRYLENAALFYLKRYSSTVAQLRRVLERKVRRSFKVHGGDPATAKPWIDALTEKLVKGGYLNDAAFAEGRARSLRSSGRSTRMIAQKLRTKGVSAQTVAAEVARASLQLPDEDAARIWARKKKLGPFRGDALLRKERRQKDLASLARAGFPYAVAKRVIDGTLDGEEP